MLILDKDDIIPPEFVTNERHKIFHCRRGSKIAKNCIVKIPDPVERVTESGDQPSKNGSIGEIKFYQIIFDGLEFKNETSNSMISVLHYFDKILLVKKCKLFYCVGFPIPAFFYF